ncbi:MAG: hypothetical protein LBH54_00355 [Clostridiales bacterium]|jgi:hypothetical protein|nr:hypothetical protein [Clostridiales bacterium]
MKKITAITLLLAMLAAVFVPSSAVSASAERNAAVGVNGRDVTVSGTTATGAEELSLTVVPSVTEANPGDEFTADIVLNNSANLVAFQYDFTFDPEVFTIDDVPDPAKVPHFAYSYIDPFAMPGCIDGGWLADYKALPAVKRWDGPLSNASAELGKIRVVFIELTANDGVSSANATTDMVVGRVTLKVKDGAAGGDTLLTVTNALTIEHNEQNEIAAIAATVTISGGAFAPNAPTTAGGKIPGGLSEFDASPLPTATPMLRSMLQGENLVEIQSVTLKDAAGAVADEFSDNGMVSGVTFQKISDTNMSGVLTVAVYEPSGRLRAIRFYDVTLNQANGAAAVIPVNVPLGANTYGCHVKAFVWASAAGMTPVSGVYRRLDGRGIAVPVAAKAGKTSVVSLSAVNASSASNANVYTVFYDVTMLELLDASALTYKSEKSAGQDAAAGVNITKFENGRFEFTANRNISAGETLRGILNLVKFKGLQTGETNVSVIVAEGEIHE